MYFKTYNVCLEKCVVLQLCLLTQPEKEEKNYQSINLSHPTDRRKFYLTSISDHG